MRKENEPKITKNFFLSMWKMELLFNEMVWTREKQFLISKENKHFIHRHVKLEMPVRHPCGDIK